jgi:hypothetical protein
MSTKENVLAILAAILGICLIGGGAWAIFLAVWGYTSHPDEPGAVLSLMLFVPGVLFLIGGGLLLRRLLKRP